MTETAITKHRPNIIPVALALVEHGGLWLVNRRDAPDSMKGLWEFPGGKIGGRESAFEAAARECREEVAIEVEPYGALSTRVFNNGDSGIVELHPIRCRLVRGKATPCETKIGPIRWVDLDELLSLAMPPANREILAQLAEQVRARAP